jgi:hypothetical protein
MTDRDKTRLEPDDQFDWVLRKVLEPTEQLRKLQTDVDALLAAAMGHFADMQDNRDEQQGAKAALRRLESLLTQAQARADKALSLTCQIANAVDQGIREPSQEAE